MKKLFLITFVFTALLAGCSSAITREKNPDKFDLLRTGVVKKENILQFKYCLIEGSEVRDRIAYNVKTSHLVLADRHRVDSFAGETYLLLSADIMNSGETRLLRLKNSSLTDLSQQINAFDTCSEKYK